MSALQDLSRWIVRDVWYYVILWDVDRLHHSIIPWVIRARQGPLSKDHRGTFSATSFHRRKLHRPGYGLAILRDTSWYSLGETGKCFLVEHVTYSYIFHCIWICLVWDCPTHQLQGGGTDVAALAERHGSRRSPKLHSTWRFLSFRRGELKDMLVKAMPLSDGAHRPKSLNWNLQEKNVF